MYKILEGDCTEKLNKDYLEKIKFFDSVDLTFLDPPFNQDKEYSEHDDNLPENEYWSWMKNVVTKIYSVSAEGAAIYFMQREKNTEHVSRILRESGWQLQNIIIWKKKTSAVPSKIRFGKHYQVIVFATKGETPKTFNRLRIDPPLPSNYSKKRENGIYLTDVWTDIRELTSGYFAGSEPLRDESGDREHKQQSPIALLLRIILSSSMPGDLILDPFAGTGTTGVVSEQLERDSIQIELDPDNVALIEKRLNNLRKEDDVMKFRKDYKHTKNLSDLWPIEKNKNKLSQQPQSQEQTRIDVF